MAPRQDLYLRIFDIEMDEESERVFENSLTPVTNVSLVYPTRDEVKHSEDLDLEIIDKQEFFVDQSFSLDQEDFKDAVLSLTSNSDQFESDRICIKCEEDTETFKVNNSVNLLD